MKNQGFLCKEAAEIVGVTYRQIDYWARTDLVKPSLATARGSGTRRMYSYRDLLELRIIKKLLDAGIRLEKVRMAFEYLRKNSDQDIASANLVISDDSVVLCEGDQLFDAVRQGQGVINVLPLVGVKDDVDASIVAFRKNKLVVNKVAHKRAS